MSRRRGTLRGVFGQALRAMVRHRGLAPSKRRWVDKIASTPPRSSKSSCDFLGVRRVDLGNARIIESHVLDTDPRTCGTRELQVQFTFTSREEHGRCRVRTDRIVVYCPIVLQQQFSSRPSRLRVPLHERDRSASAATPPRRRNRHADHPHHVRVGVRMQCGDRQPNQHVRFHGQRVYVAGRFRSVVNRDQQRWRGAERPDQARITRHPRVFRRHEALYPIAEADAANAQGRNCQGHRYCARYAPPARRRLRTRGVCINCENRPDAPSQPDACQEYQAVVQRADAVSVAV